MTLKALPGQPSSTETLSPVQRNAVEGLRRDGVAIVRFADLFPDPSTWKELADDMAGFVSETEAILPEMSRDDRVAAFGKAFLVRRFRPREDQEVKKKRPSVGLSSAWLRLGVSPEYLGIVVAYRERSMRLHDFDNWYTVPDRDVQDRVASQRWHRDGWEDHIVKVFTYFSDVDADAGPFEYVNGSTRGGKYGTLWPWEDKEVYPPQDEFEAAIDQNDRTSLTGPTGTIVFCDTSGFHRGGFARTKARVLSYHTYLSDEGQARHKRQFDVEGSDDLELVSEQARYALS